MNAFNTETSRIRSRAGRVRRLSLFLAVVSIVFALSILGCWPSSETLEGFAPEAPIRASAEVFDLLETGSSPDFLPLFDESVPVEQVEPVLSVLLPLFSGAQTREYRFASWRWIYRDSEQYHQVEYETELDGAYGVVQFVFKPNGDELFLSGLTFTPLDDSLAELNKFTIEGKSEIHFFFLAGTAAIPLFVLGCMVSCWRRRPKRRWLWLIFIPLSFPILYLNWSTGELSLNLFALNFFGAGFFRDGSFGPIGFQLAIPVGALVYLIVRPTSAKPSREEQGLSTG